MDKKLYIYIAISNLTAVTYLAKLQYEIDQFLKRNFVENSDLFGNSRDFFSTTLIIQYLVFLGFLIFYMLGILYILKKYNLYSEGIKQNILSKRINELLFLISISLIARLSIISILIASYNNSFYETMLSILQTIGLGGVFDLLSFRLMGSSKLLFFTSQAINSLVQSVYFSAIFLMIIWMQEYRFHIQTISTTSDIEYPTS